jgi:uncharacterized membrane-anchored protein YhcB (DUF1043 family)
VHISDEVFAIGTLWSIAAMIAIMAGVRIGFMIRHYRMMERTYRLQVAMAKGEIARGEGMQ